MAKQSLVVQHNRIIEAKYKLSIGEQRLIKLLVSKIEIEDEDFKSYSITVTDLINILGISDGDFYGKVKSWSKKLISNVLIFRDENDEELQVAWLSSAIYKPKGGFVELEFSPKLKPFLLHLKSHFTSYELVNVIKLKHVYSIRIYELLKQYEKLGRRRFEINFLRDLLMLEDHEYKQFSDFRKRVLITSQNELLEKTDISFTWKEERAKQKCVAIEFFIKSQGRKERENQATDTKIIENFAKNNILDSLLRIGVSKTTAEQIIKAYDEERIKSAISYAETQQKQGKIKNPAGFLVEAIKNGYRDSRAEEQERKEKEKKAREEKERQAKALKDKADELRKQAIDGFIASLDDAQLSDLEAEFIEVNKTNFAVIKSFKKNGIKSPMVNGCFRDFIFKSKLSG